MTLCQYKIFSQISVLSDNRYHLYRMLKHIRRVRDEEADLMKGISSWEVGTLFGEPIYESVPDDTYREPTMLELVVHSDPKSWFLHVFNYLFT